MSDRHTVWPSRDDYQAAVTQPQRTLRDPRLKAARVEMRALGALQVPFPRSGNFGAVYKFVDQAAGRTWALKVFDKTQSDRQQRYQLIAEHLKRQARAPYLVAFDYDEQGILVGGHRYPTLLMAWADGTPLDAYLAGQLQPGGQIDNGAFCRAWRDLVLGLQERHLAHGDLQHGNVLVTVTGGGLALVDYDGMYVPAMQPAGLTASEIGLPAYQHPKRFRGYFDERLDDFAALVMLLSLAGLDAGRWQRFHTDNGLLIQEADLLRPQASPLMHELLQSPDAPVRKLALILRTAAAGELAAIPPFHRVVADRDMQPIFRAGWHPSHSVAAPGDGGRSGRAGTGSGTADAGRRDPGQRADDAGRALLRPGQQSYRVLELLVQGQRDAEIARLLGRPPAEVSGFIDWLQLKAGVADRQALVRWALAAGLRPAGGAPGPPGPPARPATVGGSRAGAIWLAIAAVVVGGLLLLGSGGGGRAFGANPLGQLGQNLDQLLNGASGRRTGSAETRPPTATPTVAPTRAPGTLPPPPPLGSSGSTAATPTTRRDGSSVGQSPSGPTAAAPVPSAIVVVTTPGMIQIDVVADCDWTGTWQTTYGTLVIDVDEDAEGGLTGTYGTKDGQLWGRPFLNALFGIWRQGPSYAGPKDAGEFDFFITPGCNSFTGRWRYGSDGDWQEDWSGTRVN